MNRRAFFMFVAALAVLAPLSASASISLATPNTNALSNGLIGYWPLDGNTTNWTTDTTADLSGQGNAGTLVGMSTSSSSVAGKIGGALSFNGSTSDITVARSMTAKGTISVWAKPSALQVNNFPTLIGGASTAQLEFGFQRLGGTMYYKSGTFFISTYTPDNKWHLFTLTSDGTNAFLYIDGVFKEQVTFNFSSVTSLTFGATNGTAFYTGALDDIRVYNRILSAQEVALLYALGTIRAGNTPASNSSFSIDQGGLNGGLVAYWPLDGNTTSWTTGTTRDVSGNSNTGTLVGMSTSSSPIAGKIGGALKFNGSTSDIPTAYTIPAQSSATSFTWSAWLYVNPSGNIGTVVILGFRNGATWVKLTPTAFEYSSGSIISNTIPTGKWLQITVVKNGANFIYYQNGVVIGTASSAGSAVSHTFYMGGDPGFPGDGLFFGALDDVRIYNRALSAQEISDLYKAGQVNVAHSNTTSGTGINAGLVGYWTFDGPSINWRTNTVADMSGAGNTGTLVLMSTSSSPAAGKIGQALKFNGTTQEVTMPDIAPSIGNNITVSFWTKVNGSSFVQDTGFLDQQFTAGTSLKFAVMGDSDTGGTATTIGAGFYTSSAWHTVNESGSFPFGAWTMVTASYDGSTLKLYINGSLSNTTSISSTLTDNGNGWNIGKRWDMPNYVNGIMDDVRVYNRTLSAQEVQELYSASR